MEKENPHLAELGGTCAFLSRLDRPDLAYDAYLPNPAAPCVMFLSGYRSDMTGSKASALTAWARQVGVNFIRFDYSGVGLSAGRFEDYAVGDWRDDAMAIIEHVVPPDVPVIVVGSSMGGWLALSLAVARPDRVAGVVGLAAAPDFTGEMWQRLTPAQQKMVQTEGFVTYPSTVVGYAPYHLSRRLFEQGHGMRLLDRAHDLSIPIVLLHGAADTVVPTIVPAMIAQAFPQATIDIEMVPGGDHSLSRPEDLARLYVVVQKLIALCI